MKISVNEQEKRLVYINFFRYFSWLLGAKKHMDCCYTQPCVPFAVFNSVIDTHLDEKIALKAISEIKSIYQQTKQFCWWITDFVKPQSLTHTLEEMGFTKGDPFVGMIYPLEGKIRIPNEVAHIEVKQVVTPTMLDDWMKPVQEAFNIDDISAQFCAKVFKDNFTDKRLKHFYVQAKGEIIATATLFIEDLVSGFYNLAVLPPYRNQHIASALKWHRLKMSQDLGARYAVLQSSRMGQKCDLNIGFKPVSMFIPYFSPV
ncbi:MAG: GNAT family N-acetyltransferase [Candidatus Berkiella sp.]